MSRFGDLPLSRPARGDYGSLEEPVRRIRAHRPLDLNAERWRARHPGGSFDMWREQARGCLLQGLHCDPGPANLRPEVLDSEERDGLTVERVAFTATPWSRLQGYFLRPSAAPGPLPGLVVLHAWGGPMLFGKDRIVNSGRDHPVLVEHRSQYYSGRYLAEVFAAAGYAVVVVDAWHFGERAPRGLGAAIPARYDPFDLDEEEYQKVDGQVRAALYLGVRQLNWAGTTWMGVNYWDDSRCVDYLLSRPEVDGRRTGCTGLSGGGWRTNVLAALDGRIKASVSVGWMTTGDYQQVYNVDGAIGTFCLLPGVWDRLDVPDLTIMAPGAAMVVSGQRDELFPLEGQADAARQIRAGYEWAGRGDRFRDYRPDKDHCYDAEIQAEALRWFGRHLGAGG